MAHLRACLFARVCVCVSFYRTLDALLVCRGVSVYKLCVLCVTECHMWLCVCLCLPLSSSVHLCYTCDL